MELLIRTATWKEALKSRRFLQVFIVGVLAGLSVLTWLTRFFRFVDARPGAVLQDPILPYLPAHNVSPAIFLLIWAVSLLLLIRCLREPVTLLLFVYGFIFLTLSRLASMYLAPLDPPPGLIPLVDPLANHFYGDKFVTRDLFYSGHTGTLLVVSLCLWRRLERWAGLLATLAVGVLVLVQRVHYTLDVAAAFPFAALCYYGAAKLIQSVGIKI